MHFWIKIVVCLTLGIQLTFLPLLKGADRLLGPYITWVDDPCSTMTVLWATKQESPPTNTSSISYTLEDYDFKWEKVVSKANEITNTDVVIHSLTLRNLQQDQTYLFKIEEDTEIYRFKTMPSSIKHPVRFAVGGDLYPRSHQEGFHAMNQFLTTQELDFIILGGDLAYTHSWRSLFKSRQCKMDHWIKFMKALNEIRGKQNQLIPLLMVVGNHDIEKSGEESISKEIVYQLFGLSDLFISYRCLDFGSYLSLFLLDTGHSCPISGNQTLWLQKSLQERNHYPFKMAIYHESAYPSYYLYNSRTPKQIRSHWVPLFEEYGLNIGFEHHNHCYKRTYPIRDGKVTSTEQSGVIYLGDGCWGVKPRHPHNVQNAWFLEKAGSFQSCYIVILDEQGCEIQARTPKGALVDQINLKSAQKAVPVNR